MFESFLDRLEGRLCSAGEVARLKRICSVIPDRTTFIHGDCHPGNVMERDGKLILIDLSSCAYGHPVFDLAGMYSIYMMSAQDEGRRKRLVPARDFTAAECCTIWETFLNSYFETKDEAFYTEYRSRFRDLSGCDVCSEPSSLRMKTFICIARQNRQLWRMWIRISIRCVFEKRGERG